MLLKDVMNEIDKICPFSLQEDWDHSGLQVGDPHGDIKKVLVAFDFTERVLVEAIEKKADMILTHHPFFFKGIQQIDLSCEKGRMISGLLKNNIALVACHTNLDKIEYGVSAVLGKMLGLCHCHPFIPEGEGIGFGVLGKLAEPMKLSDFAHQIKSALGIPMVRIVGGDITVLTVVAMGGAGSDFIGEAKKQGADVYVTADLKYHDGQAAAEMGLALIDAGHFETEVATMAPFAEKLASFMPTINFMLSENMTSYWHML